MMDDLISRQQAIDALKQFKPEIIPYEKARSYVEETIDTMYNRIEDLPTVQPERKKGKWIYNSPVTMKCDQCGLVIKDWDWHRFKICPNCGADMRGRQNG